jgi:transcriptional regulator with XRE-family HTH domain
MESMVTKHFATYPGIVGQILAKKRQLASLEQAELAAKIGLTQSSWSKIERGDTAISIEQLKNAARILGTTPSDIIQLADATVTNLEKNKVKVVPDRDSANSLPSALVILSVVALGIWIAKSMK